MSEPHMPPSSLVELLHLIEAAGINVWLDGGWGVDALLGTQIRPHRDVDLILQVADVPTLESILLSRGYRVREGSPPDSFVLADAMGHEVDVHAVNFDDDGNGHYLMQNGETWIFPAEGFSGHGAVDGKAVQCLSPATQVLCHAHGYVPTEKDVRDMAALQGRFSVKLPRHLRDGS